MFTFPHCLRGKYPPHVVVYILNQNLDQDPTFEVTLGLTNHFICVSLLGLYMHW